MTESRSHPWLAIGTRAVVAAAVLSVGVLVFSALYWTRPKAASSGAAQPRPRVPVMLAKRVEVRRPWRGYGVAQAMHEAAVPARVSATVAAIPQAVEPGNAVRAGDLLVRLDPTDFERELTIARQRLAELDAQLAQLDVQQRVLEEQWELATADLAIARDELARVEQLFERNAESRQGLDQSRRAVIVAQRSAATIREQREAVGPRRDQLRAARAGQAAAVAAAEANLQRTAIVSPIVGTLRSVDAEVGENVRVGDQVAYVVDLSRIEVHVRLPASARTAAEIGDEVILEAGSSGPDPRKWTAKLTRIAPTDDAETRTLTVYAELEQPQEGASAGAAARAALLNPGTFVAATVLDNDAQWRWVVPRRSVREQRIFVVTGESRVVSRPARIDYGLEGAMPDLGLSDDDQWAVIDADLQAGDRVVLEASSTRLDGQWVEAVPPDASGPSAAAASEAAPPGVEGVP